jgi:hypothetical protein
VVPHASPAVAAAVTKMDRARFHVIAEFLCAKITR